LRVTRFFLSAIPIFATIFLLGASAARPREAQDASQKPAEKTSVKPQEKAQEKTAPKPAPKLPAEIELLETRIRFETDGSSRKEVHARVQINDELGVRQFARLNFDFNRSFEQIEIPLVRTTHLGGGTADVLPSAITDSPNPVVVNAPAYQDVRVKSVRILGLEPGDTLEYRVITTISRQPMAPNFWFEHSFDRSGIVLREILEVNAPSLSNLHHKFSPATPPVESPKSSSDDSSRSIYRWDRKAVATAEQDKETAPTAPDVALSTFDSWSQLADRLASLLIPTEQQSRELSDKAVSLAGQNAGPELRIGAIYDFVAQKIRTIDLPLGATGFLPHKPGDTLAAGYGTTEDKFLLFASLGNNLFGPARAGLVCSSCSVGAEDLPSPARFDHLLTMSGYPSISFWLDLGVEVVPFRVIPIQFRERPVFVIGPSIENRWETVSAPLPFPSSQKVSLSATLDSTGKLSARLKYVMRGDNELLLRVAFHQTPKENWKNVAQLLALSDGFRGQIENVTASDPYATHEPFTVEYEITQAKSVDWSKKPLRIPALLPVLGLPDPPAKPAAGAAISPIDLGTPLDVEVSVTLLLPAGTTAHVPAGTSIARDFATYTSQYSAKDATLTASRHLNFILKEIPADRAADYNAFLRAVQSDESQVFTLERADTIPAAPQKP
jgi:hypothetical protein